MREHRKSAMFRNILKAGNQSRVITRPQLLAPGPTPCLLLFRGLQRHEKVISIIYNKALLTTTQEAWLDVFFWNRILSATSTSVFYSKVVQECDSMLPHVFPFTTFVSMTPVSFFTPVGGPMEDYHSHSWTGLYNPTTNR